MNKYVKGIPVVLIFFVLALLVPILVADFVLYHALSVKPMVVTKTVMVTPTATPSATLAPTKSLFRVVSPTVSFKAVTVQPTVAK